MSETDPRLDEIIRNDALQPQTQDDWISYLGQAYFLVSDPEVVAMLKADPDLTVLMPALSSMVRTSNLTPKTVAILKVRWRMACKMQLLSKKSAELVDVTKYQIWLMHGYAALEDALHGWRGRLVTEKVRSYKIEGDSKKRSRFLGMFGR